MRRWGDPVVVMVVNAVVTASTSRFFLDFLRNTFSFPIIILVIILPFLHTLLVVVLT